MRSAAKFSLVLSGILLVISTLFQSLALCSVLILESTPAPVFTENDWLVPLWAVALVLLPAGFFLCIALREKGIWLTAPLVVAGVGAFLALIVALTLKEGLAPTINALGNTQGLTPWKLCYRHLSSVAAGVLTVLAAVLHMFACRADRIRREEAGYKPVYNLGGKAVFKDSDSTLGLEDAETDKPTRPLKRSQRQALKKQLEKQQKEQS